MIEDTTIFRIHILGEAASVICEEAKFEPNDLVTVTNEVKTKYFDTKRFFKEKMPDLNEDILKLFTRHNLAHKYFSENETVYKLDSSMTCLSIQTSDKEYDESYTEAIEDYLEDSHEHLEKLLTKYEEDSLQKRFSKLTKIKIWNWIYLMFAKTLSVNYNDIVWSNDPIASIALAYKDMKDKLIKEYDEAEELLEQFILDVEKAKEE